MSKKVDKIKKINRCFDHVPSLFISWEGEESCPLCVTYKANEKLVSRIDKLKNRIEKLKKKLSKFIPKKKKKKKVFWD